MIKTNLYFANRIPPPRRNRQRSYLMNDRSDTEIASIPPTASNSPACPDDSIIAPTPAAPVMVRDATVFDIPAITAIYRQAVLEGTASFEEIAPDENELAKRQQALIAGGFPYLVAVEETTGDLCGYAYAGPYRPRTAYRHTVEDSIYVAPAHQGKGIGSLLITSLIERCDAGPWRQMVAAIGDSQNHGSIALHRKHGFQPSGTFYNVGYKFGRWLDSVLMQRSLNSGTAPIPAPVASTTDHIPIK